MQVTKKAETKVHRLEIELTEEEMNRIEIDLHTTNLNNTSLVVQLVDHIVQAMREKASRS